MTDANADDAKTGEEDAGNAARGVPTEPAAAAEPTRSSYLNTAALLVGVWVVSFLTAAVLVNAAMLAASGRWLAPSDAVPAGFRLAQFPVPEAAQVQDSTPPQTTAPEGTAADVAIAASASVMMPSPDLLTWNDRDGAQLRAAVPTQPPADSPSPPALQSAAMERHFIWQVKEDREGVQHILVSRRIGPLESVSRYTVTREGQATAIYYGEADHGVLLQYTVIHALWISLLIVSVLGFRIARRSPPAAAAPGPGGDAAEPPTPERQDA